MTLDQFLGLPGAPTATEFGFRCSPPLSGATISRIRKGTQNISMDVMSRIIAASDGMITADALLRTRLAA